MRAQMMLFTVFIAIGTFVLIAEADHLLGQFAIGVGACAGLVGLNWFLNRLRDYSRKVTEQKKAYVERMRNPKQVLRP